MLCEYLQLTCNGCGERSGSVAIGVGGRESSARALDAMTATWLRSGDRHFCPACGEAAARTRAEAIRRGGFTLIEILAVLAIIGIVAVVALPVVLEATGANSTTRAASLLQGELAAAVARAQRDGESGLRLIPDDAFPVKRLADGSVDPAAPLAYSRVIPLERPDAIQDGRVSIRGSFPAGFPALGTKALVLEQEVAHDDGGIRVPNEPTAWAWRVRLGDRVELAGRTFTVCGPMNEANPEGFVNYPGPGTGLDRGDGWAEWLLLVNGRDDDDDGSIDNGYNGRDENVDGAPDDGGEWTEVESWGLSAPVLDARYLIRPRPVPIVGRGLELAGALVDATGWAGAEPPRSRLPIDRITGFVDLVVFGDGRVEPVGRYAPTVPAVGLLKRPHIHFWIAPREAVASAEPSVGALLTVSARTGRVAWSVADPANPTGAFREAEGGGL